MSAGDKDPLIKEIVESKDMLLEKRFPVVFREMKESGKEYFDAEDVHRTRLLARFARSDLIVAHSRTKPRHRDAWASSFRYPRHFSSTYQ